MAVNSYLCEGVGGVEHLTICTKKNELCIYVTFKLYDMTENGLMATTIEAKARLLSPLMTISSVTWEVPLFSDGPGSLMSYTLSQATLDRLRIRLPGRGEPSYYE